MAAPAAAVAAVQQRRLVQLTPLVVLMVAATV
jgi:hypothetical protein